MTERTRTMPDDADAVYVWGFNFVPDEPITAAERAATGLPALTAGDQVPGRSFDVRTRVRLVDGVPTADAMIITGLGIDSKALAKVTTRTALALAGQTFEILSQETEAERHARQRTGQLLDDLLAMWLGGETPVAKEPREPLTRPDGTDPDGFSRRVAAAYRDVVTASSAPAKVLAAEAGVPVRTVHGWIREARRAGYLAPTKKGSRS